MEHVSVDYFCADCGFAFDGEAKTVFACNKECPKCGSNNRCIKLNISESVIEHEAVRLKGKNENFPSKKKLTRDLFVGHEQRNSDGKWMIKERDIDKDNDKYREIIVDSETGEIPEFV